MPSSTLLQDLRYATRTLRKSPESTLTAIATIALGIGASTVIFSVANAVLFHALPYKDPGGLVIARRDDLKRSVQDYPISTPDFLDLRNGTRNVFESLEGIEVVSGRFALPGVDGAPEQVRSNVVTPGFLRSLGAMIVLGRDFEEADGPYTFTILSYEYWRRRYGGDSSILGRTIPGTTALVVGILEPGFELLFPPDANLERAPDFWFAEAVKYDNSQRNSAHLRLLARLKPSATLEGAQASAEAVSGQLRREFAMKEASGFQYRLVPMQGHLVAEARPALLVLMGAVTFLLLIACSNVANLLLVRSSLRERELAVRAALGAGRWRIVRQMLTEALLLAGCGAALGFGLAWAGIRELLAIAPASVPRLDAVKMDGSVLMFAALAALGTAALFGIPPALKASRPNLIGILRASSRASALRGGRILRNAVVIAEVALCFVLLIGLGLMARSFIALRRTDPGFNPRNLLTFRAEGSPVGPADRRAAFLREFPDRLRAIPGVQGVAGANTLPLDGAFYPIRWARPEDHVDPKNLPTAADYQVVLPGFFEAMGARLLQGRTFADDDNQAGRNVVILDDLLAKRAFPSGAAVGRQLLVTNFVDASATPMEVIGVVAHERESSLAVEGHEQLYFTNGFVGDWRLDQWAVRTSGDPAKYVPALRSEAAKMGRNLLLTEIEPMEAIVDRAEASTRFALVLIGVFAAIAAVLAAVGLYGVLSALVRQRTAEIGVRVALGARPAEILKLIVGQGMTLSVIGLGIGLLGAVGLTRTMSSLLVGVTATDPLTFSGMAVLFLAITAAAAWVPARRAAALDPAVALREE